MKTVRTRPKYALINVRGLMLIYFLLCILTILFARTFFTGILREGGMPGPLNLIIFFTIPVILVAFLTVSILSLLRDIASRRAGSRFRARLIAYFIVTVIFAAVPVTIITIQSVYMLARFWRGIEINHALDSAQAFALENYAFHLEKLEEFALNKCSAPPVPPPEAFRGTAGPMTVQDFQRGEEGLWENSALAGDPSGELGTPPGFQPGFVSREMPRDADLIRYIVFPRKDLLRVISYSLGTGFDRAIDNIANEQTRLGIIDSLRTNIRSLLILYYGVFFVPILLMTFIIAISFTRRVTQPIVELTEATRRVAEGDFSIQILSRPGDELGLLIRSFNLMVQDLEKSRAALVKTEKISLWQDMAQQLAHEIKNPLTPIKLSAERVLRRWRNEPERVSEILENSMLAIIQEVEGLSNLLNEFKTLSRPIAPSLAWTNLRELLEEAISPYHSSHPGVEFNAAHVGDILLKIDRRHILQVLTNLFINAIDAMDGRGRVEIRTDLVKKRETRYCRLSIGDTGKGISQEDGPRIFTPYFTTKKSGTGLGLPIVERIINDHGGTIWFNSAAGAGTTFFIDLPMDESKPVTGEGQDNDQHTHH